MRKIFPKYLYFDNISKNVFVFQGLNEFKEDAI